jgi:hypothetical protein
MSELFAEFLVKRKSMSDVMTNDDYWDCECREEHIHAKSKGNYCPRCDKFEREQPDSRENELHLHRPESDCAVFKDYKERQQFSVAFRPKQKGVQAGTLVRITRTKAPRGLPVDCVIEGILLADVQLGKPVYLAAMDRSGELVDGIFASALVDGVSPQGFTAAGALYCVDLLGEPGDFSLLAEVLLRELRPHEAHAM